MINGITLPPNFNPKAIAMLNKRKLGLSLSGGGYRAAAFHLGTLRTLHQLNILDKVDVMSTISGGSITGACYCLSDKDFDAFMNEMEQSLTTKNVITYVLTSPRTIPMYLVVLALLASLVYLPFTAYAWVSVFVLAFVIALIVKFQFRIFPASKIIEKAYEKFFYHHATLSSLSDNKPLLAIGSTNIQTCRPFTFSKRKMEDSTYTYRNPPILFKQEDFPLARAVMASSCVPFAFTPISIDKEFYKDPEQYKDINPKLVDGGVYDNQGIQKLTQAGNYYECDIIITSDAGNKLPFTQSYNNVFVLLIRTMDVFMARIKNFQLAENVYNNVKDGVNKEIAYLSLGWNLEDCIPGFVKNLAAGNVTASVIAAHAIPQEWLQNVNAHANEITRYMETRINYAAIKAKALTPEQLAIARSVGTNLTCLSKQQVQCLAGHAAVMSAVQVQLYCPSLLITPAAATYAVTA